MRAIFAREVKAHFHSVVSYAFFTFVLLFAGIFTMALNLYQLHPNFEFVLNGISFIFTVGIPALTMRTIAEERRQKTDQLLYALPLSLSEVVMGKYFALLTVLAVPVIIMAFYPLILLMFGPVLISSAYSALLAFFLLGAALMAMGMFISSLTDNQALAAVLCFVIMMLNMYLTSLASLLPGTANASLFAFAVIVLLLGLIVKNFTQSKLAGTVFAVAGLGLLCAVRIIFPTVLEGLFGKIMSQLSVHERFNNFVTGVFDINAIVYYITVIVVLLFFTVQTMEKRRWA